MANNPIVNSLTFVGSVAGQASIQAQGLAGGLTFLLPNTSPSVSQLLTVSVVSGNNVFFGWANQQSTSVALSQITQSSATTNQVIQWNGTAWVAATLSAGSGTVTSVSGAGIATGTVTTTGSITVLGTSTNSSHTAVTDSGGGQSIATATSGMAITADGNGNAHSSGTLLSSLAPLASPTFTGTVTASTISGPGGTFTISANTASIVIANTGGVTVTPAAGTVIALGNARFTSALTDGSAGFGSTGTAGQVLTSTGGGSPTTLWASYPASFSEFSVAGFAAGVGTNNQILLRIGIAFPVLFPAGAAVSIASASANATGSTTYTLSHQGTPFATVTFGVGSAVGTWVQASDSLFNAGDILEIDGPATADATLANVGITLAGTKQ